MIDWRNMDAETRARITASLPEVVFEKQRKWEQENGIVRKAPPKLTVYFVLCEGFLKIGYASNLTTRMVDFAVGCPFQQELILAYRGTKQTESDLHKRFAHLRHRGEWFRYQDDLRAFVEAHPKYKNCKISVKRSASGQKVVGAQGLEPWTR